MNSLGFWRLAGGNLVEIFFFLAIVQGGTIELSEQRTIRRWAGWHSMATLSAKFNPQCAVQIFTEFLLTEEGRWLRTSLYNRLT